MLIKAKCDGEVTEHDLPDKPFLVAVHQSGIKIEVPEALLIDAKATTKCMEGMSQKAWVHISTGPLFQHFFDELFKDHAVTLPENIATLIADYDEGVIHACGLIVMLCEAMFERKRKVFLKNPETHLHPAVVARLMTVILDIQKLSGRGGDFLEVLA